MAFRIEDLSLQVNIHAAGGQPGGCTCGPASGAGQPEKPPPCANSRRPAGPPNKPGGPPKKRALDDLRTQLRGMLAAPM